MLREYQKIDKNGFVVGDSQVWDDENVIPANYKLTWSTEESFYIPKWDSKKAMWIESQNPSIPLAGAKEDKKGELSIACQKAILGRFPSKHKGVSYTFSYDKEAQTNFAERWNLFQNNIITSIKLTAKTTPGEEVKRIQVNREEFTIIYLDSIKHKENCISRLQDLLIPMVNNAVSLKQLADIHWSNVSVFPGEPSIEVKDDATLAKGVKTAYEKAELAKDSSELTTTAFMEAMGLLFGGKM